MNEVDPRRIRLTSFHRAIPGRPAVWMHAARARSHRRRMWRSRRAEARGHRPGPQRRWRANESNVSRLHAAGAGRCVPVGADRQWSQVCARWPPMDDFRHAQGWRELLRDGAGKSDVSRWRVFTSRADFAPNSVTGTHEARCDDCRMEPTQLYFVAVGAARASRTISHNETKDRQLEGGVKTGFGGDLHAGACRQGHDRTLEPT